MYNRHVGIAGRYLDDFKLNELPIEGEEVERIRRRRLLGSRGFLIFTCIFPLFLILSLVIDCFFLGKIKAGFSLVSKSLLPVFLPLMAFFLVKLDKDAKAVRSLSTGMGSISERIVLGDNPHRIWSIRYLDILKIETEDGITIYSKKTNEPTRIDPAFFRSAADMQGFAEALKRASPNVLTE